MTLCVNNIAINSTSRGGRRYYDGIIEKLDLNPLLIPTALPSNSIYRRIREILLLTPSNQILWSPAHRGSLVSKTQVITVLDLINLQYVYSGISKAILSLYLKYLFNNSLQIVAISNATKAVVVNRLNIDDSKVKVIQGPTYFPELHLHKNDFQFVGLVGKPFFLVVANDLTHKNIGFVIDSYNACRTKKHFDLVIIGNSNSIFAEKCYLSSGVKLLADVSDSTLTELLYSSIGLISPSLDEGLNLPVGEALSAGVNCFVSDIPVHVELYSGAVTFFDPYKLDSLIAIFDNFPDYSNKNITSRNYKKITFEDVAAQYQTIFDSLAGITT